jgi:hypothetical protein
MLHNLSVWSFFVGFMAKARREQKRLSKLRIRLWPLYIAGFWLPVFEFYAEWK